MISEGGVGSESVSFHTLTNFVRDGWFIISFINVPTQHNA